MKRIAMLLGASFIATALANAANAASIEDTARQIEDRLDARVGLAIHDTDSGKSWLHNGDARFPMASTFKALACGALLARVDAGEESLEQTVPIEKGDLVPYAPVTEGWVGQTVSLGALCAATLRTSDNAAANKVLQRLGGPAGVTAFMRAIGDETTRLDRWETDLNEGAPGDERDTTTPKAIAAALQRLILGNTLSETSRAQLTAWLEADEVGGPLLRAGIPRDWRIIDRTGAGGHGVRGVIAVMWPPKRAPIVAAIYITDTEASMDERNAAIAQLGEALAATVAQ